MAFSNVDATWINAVAGSPAYDETELRRADAIAFAGAGDTADSLKVQGGIASHASNSLAVTVDGSDVVTVQAGGVVIPGNNTTGNGAYRAALGAAQTDILTTRDATNGRIDLVVFEVISGGTQARVRIIAGVPSGSPSAPALPARAVELTRITVPASGGGVAAVDNSKRTFAAALGGDLLVTTFSQLPTTAAPRQVAVTLDTGIFYDWSGTAWVARDTGWIAPDSLAASWLSVGSPYGAVGYRRLNGYVQLRGALRDGTSGQAAFFLPAGFRPANDYITVVWSSHASNISRLKVRASDGAVYLDQNAVGGVGSSHHLTHVSFPAEA